MYTMIRRPVNAFAPFFAEPVMREFFGTPNVPAMKVDIREEEGAYLLETELPGVKKEDIRLHVEKDVLTVSAEMNAHKKEEQEGYLCSERRYCRAERSFNLEGIDAAAITAGYENGVLTVKLPKAVPAEKDSYEIAIGAPEQEKAE